MRNLTHEETRQVAENKPHEEVLYFIARTAGRVASFSRYFRIGRAHGYPVCCVTQWSWEVAQPRFRRQLGAAQKRGSIAPNGNHEHRYVPCSLHMRRSPYWRAWNEDDNRRQLKLFTMEPKR